MFKRLRHLAMLLAVAGVVVSLVLLANFTAPNPTGRRYSSAIPSRQLTDMQRGFDAERILSLDLKTPTNNSSEAGQCICNQTYAPNSSPRQYNCNVCLVYSPLVSTYNIPDFVTDHYIVEAKDALTLDPRSHEQIRNFALMATELRRPLWLFVSKRGEVHPQIVKLVADTGGQVVPYFSFPGYVDPVDQLARNLLIVSGGALGVMLMWEALSRRRPPGGSGGSGGASRRPRKPGPASPLEEAQEFTARVKEKRRVEIDTEDARDELR